MTKPKEKFFIMEYVFCITYSIKKANKYITNLESGCKQFNPTFYELFGTDNI